MIIGHFMPGIWDQGGIGVYISRIATSQREHGHTVHFLDSLDRYANVPDPEFRAQVVNVSELVQKSTELHLDVLHLHSSVEPLPIGGPPVVRTVHDHRPYCPSGERYLKRTGKPCDRSYNLFGCLQGHLIDRCGSVRPLSVIENFKRTFRERRTLPYVTSIAISQFVKDQMIRSGYDGRTIHVLRNPAPATRTFSLPPSSGVPRFLFMGRLSVHKGVFWLLQCLAKLDRPFELDIAGDGPELSVMEALATHLGIRDRITFHGWVGESKLDELAAECRAVIFPVVWHEPAGLVSLDAASRGRAVIASRSGGIPEFAVEGRNALIVTPRDDAGMIEAIRKLIDNWDLARQLGEAGYAMAAGEFSLGRHIEDLDRMYHSLPEYSGVLAEMSLESPHES